MEIDYRVREVREFGEKLKKLRRTRNLTQADLSRRINASEITVRSWETGIKTPSMSNLKALARALHVSVDYLLGVESSSESRFRVQLSDDESTLLGNYRELDKPGKQAVIGVCEMEKQRINSQWYRKNHFVARAEPADVPRRFLPLFATPAAAGVATPIDGEDYELIPADLSVPLNADFAVRIQGDSMEPWIKDGAIVYVDKDAPIRIGDVGIFCVDGAMYCKQFFMDENNNITLVSANEACKRSNVHISYDGGSFIQCFGRVLLDEKTPLPAYFTED